MEELFETKDTPAAATIRCPKSLLMVRLSAIDLIELPTRLYSTPILDLEHKQFASVASYCLGRYRGAWFAGLVGQTVGE